MGVQKESDITIAVIGLWHLGCTIAAAWSKLGQRAICFDYDKDTVDNLKAGIPPIFEPYLAETLKDASDKSLVSFSNDIKTLQECDFVFLAYDTKVLDNDKSDTSLLEKSVNDASLVMKDNSVLIVSSQSPVGFCSVLRNCMKDVNKTLDLAYSPENLRLGEAIDCYLNPGRIILGTASAETENKCLNLFKSITSDVLSMSLESAEMIKHGINSFLATSIVFANNLADICEQKEANITDVIKGIKSDDRIGQKAYLAPGIGFSGGTLGRDLKILSGINKSGEGFAQLFETVHKLNNERKYSIVNKLKNLLGNLEGQEIAVLGLTYKPGTSTLRRSLPLEVVDLLIKNQAIVKAFDPKADFNELDTKPAFEIAEDIESVAENANLILLLTEWPEFKEYEWQKIPAIMRDNFFYDTKNFFNKDSMSNLGFKYYTIGEHNEAS